MKKKIVILGIGFGGLHAAQWLQKHADFDQCEVTVIDKNSYQLFRADLYEVATAFNEKITKECLSRLKDTVATPAKWLLDADKTKFLRGTIKKINPAKKNVVLQSGQVIDFDYLLVALGSVTNDFGIPGLKKYAFPLKKLKDALAINCHLDQSIHDLWESGKKRDFYITVGGGGATGVETAAELVGSLKKLAKKYGYPQGKLHVQLVEGGDDLAALDQKGTEIVMKRLKKLGVSLKMNTFIAEVGKDFIKVKNPKTGRLKKISSDITIWTGGVKVSEAAAKSLGDKEKRGAIVVDKFLRVENCKNVFAVGDNAYFLEGGRPLPMMAHIAYRQGVVAAKNILKSIKGKSNLKKYKAFDDIYLLPVGGRYALMKLGPFLVKGRWVWWFKKLIFFRYSWSILPFVPALKKTIRRKEIFVKND